VVTSQQVALYVQVKREHYRALAHYYVALGLLDHVGEMGERTRETLQFLHDTKEDKHQIPASDKDRKYLGKDKLLVLLDQNRSSSTVLE
jgi:hypothetical protein